MPSRSTTSICSSNSAAAHSRESFWLGNYRCSDWWRSRYPRTAATNHKPSLSLITITWLESSTSGVSRSRLAAAVHAVFARRDTARPRSSGFRWGAATRLGQALLDAVDIALESRGESRPTESITRAELATLSWPETVAWLGKRLAGALHYANSRGVLHRDIKLANVLLAPDGTPKLADFNVSFSRNVSGASPFDYFGGSLSYMSPEQLMACRPGHTLEAVDLDTRSDIYSLAVVLWELLTGLKPFDDSAAQAARADSAELVGDTTALELMLTTRAEGISSAALAAPTQ